MNSFIRKNLLLASLMTGICLLATAAKALDVSLEWSTWDEGTFIDHFVIYWGNESGVYTNNSTPIQGNITNHTITGLNDGDLYYFAIKSFDAKGNESEYSNEAKTFDILSPGDNFKANLSNYTSFTLTGIGFASTTVEVFDQGSMTLLGSTTSDAAGNWSMTLDMTGLSQGPVVLQATQGTITIEISGIYDIDPPMEAQLVSIVQE